MSVSPSFTTQWIAHFQCNAEHRPTPRWHTTCRIPGTIQPALRRWAQDLEYAIGHGPGRLISRHATSCLARDPDLAQVIEAWLAEEKSHADLLRQLRLRCGDASSPAAAVSWTLPLFLFMRRVVAFEQELQILSLSELAGSVSCWLLLRHLPDPALRDVCTLMLRDGRGHLAFHAELLRQRAQQERHAVGSSDHQRRIQLAGLGAAAALWFAHRGLFQSLNLSASDFFSEARHQIRQHLRRLQPDVTPPRHPAHLPEWTLSEV
ncbi:MAG: hypothetical protein KDK99_04815 [Verrucomicrobiales bacterium]|nr:hypothetical protein [Verrucomicrobiales bacterium]